jgi:DNA-binding XRE family transcriptional regulator
VWAILEHNRLDRQLARTPREVLKRYEKRKDIARLSGPPGLRLIKGFHDEALAGKWAGSRSSRLGDHWRVIYHVDTTRSRTTSSRLRLTTIGGNEMRAYRVERNRATVTVGESVRIIRELQGLSQNELAQRTGISQATISAIENDRVRLGVERAKALARALKCHPGVLMFPGWVVPTENAA